MPSTPTHTPPFEPDPELFPFRSRWFESSVGSVHYIDEGEGLPILFLHGNPTWSFLYRGIVVRLRKHFRCIALDYPGFGLSVHPDAYDYKPKSHAGVVREFVRWLDLERLTIMGHDWGGPIGMRVALDEVDRLHALVMGNTWYWPMEAMHVKAYAKAMSSDPLQWLIREKNFFVERVMPLASKREIADEVKEHYRAPFARPERRRGVLEMARQILDSSFWLGEIGHAVPRMLADVPLLLTWGTHDLMFGSGFMARFREDFRNVTIERLDARHYIQEDRPAEVAEAVRGFLLED